MLCESTSKTIMSSGILEIDSRSPKYYKMSNSKGSDIVTSKQYVITLLEKLNETYNYTFINDIYKLTQNIIIQSNQEFTSINIKFIFAENNQIIIGIKPHLSLKCSKITPFKSIKDQIIFEQAKCIFLRKNKLI